MPNKIQFYSQMADYAAAQLTGSFQSWTAFLETSARLYKYPFHEQLMIFAQRPEATACAEYDLWNEKMHRYVKRGSKGIALIDTSGDAPRLKYVFDVADTGGNERSRRPFLWELKPEHTGTVTEALSERFRDPVLSDLRIIFATGVQAEAYPRLLRNIYRGGTLEFVGRVPAGTADVRFSLRGLNGGEVYEGFFRLPFGSAASDPALANLWRREADVARKIGVK